jgi:hypothetical protein
MGSPDERHKTSLMDVFLLTEVTPFFNLKSLASRSQFQPCYYIVLLDSSQCIQISQKVRNLLVGIPRVFCF